MIKNNFLIYFIVYFFIINSLNSQSISLEDIFVTYKFYPAVLKDFYHLKDGETYALLEGNEINIYDYKKGKKIKTLFNASDFNLGKIDEFIISPDESKILILTNTEKIYRYSKKSICYLFDLKENKLTKVRNEHIQEPSFSPNSSFISYVYENNIYVYNIKNKEEYTVTLDGKKNYIINGIPDWVYEEEFSFSKAYEWSYDSRYIAYLCFNEENVKEFTIQYYKDLYPEEYKYKYPKAGEKNSIVTLKIYDLFTKKTLNIKLDNDEDYYIPRIYWANKSNILYAFKLNRLQNELKIFAINAENENVQIIYYEKSNTYIELPEILFSKDDKYLFITSDKDGYNHIYMYETNGNFVKQITKGEYDVTKINSFDEEEQKIFYTSTELGSIYRNLFVYDIKYEKKLCLTPEKGYNNSSFTIGNKYFINEFSKINKPPVYTLYDKNGKKIRDILSNVDLEIKIKESEFSDIEFFLFKINDTLDLNGLIVKPRNFDINKKYPVLFYVYGGPGHQEVLDQWDYFKLWFQYLVSKDIVVVSIDNRGTGGKGSYFKKCTYRQLGNLESEDQIYVAKNLINIFPFIDTSKIGIYGWSFGGYLSLLCLAKGATTFKYAIAVAPVTNWRFYDTIYTERYNDLPQNNPSGYDNNSPINLVKKIKGKLLLIHGTADDNVHFQNSLEFIKKLVEHNKYFTCMFYPNSNHGIYTGKNTRFHLFNLISNFIFDNSF